MSIYLLAYDLVNKPTEFDYEPLWAELKRLGAHRTQYSLWLLDLNNTAQEVVEHFQKFVHTNDRLWATKIRRREHHYVNAMAGTNKWLTEHPPE